MPRSSKLTERQPGVYTYRNGNALLIDASKAEGGTETPKAAQGDEVDKTDPKGGESHSNEVSGDKKVRTDK